MRKLLAFSALLMLLTISVLSVFSQSQHSITLTWTYAADSDPAVSFNVYRATVSGGPFTQKLNSTPIPLSTLTWSDATGNGGTTYFYVVTAVDAAGVESGDSPQASATFLASVPSIPANVKAVAK